MLALQCLIPDKKIANRTRLSTAARMWKDNVVSRPELERSIEDDVSSCDLGIEALSRCRRRSAATPVSFDQAPSDRVDAQWGQLCYCAILLAGRGVPPMAGTLCYG